MFLLKLPNGKIISRDKVNYDNDSEQIVFGDW